MKELDSGQLRQVYSCLPKNKNLLTKAYRGELNLRQAIKAMCIFCVGEVREDIYVCKSTICPLWMYRPKPTKTQDDYIAPKKKSEPRVVLRRKKDE